MKKLIAVGLACTMLAIGMTGCSEKTRASYPVKLYAVADDFSLGGIYTFKDSQTGVWYYVSYKGGATPRYNTDGTLYAGDRP